MHSAQRGESKREQWCEVKITKKKSSPFQCKDHDTAQVKQIIQLERNINSDFTLAATTTEYIDRRGERNVPKRYLKEADWCEDGPLGTGYYIACPDNPLILIPIDFNFKHLQWGCTHPKKDRFVVERPAPATSRCPAHSAYLRLTHKLWASCGHALRLLDWRLVSGFDCVGTPE